MCRICEEKGLCQIENPVAKTQKGIDAKIAYDARNVETDELNGPNFNFGWVSACEYVASLIIGVPSE